MVSHRCILTCLIKSPGTQQDILIAGIEIQSMQFRDYAVADESSSGLSTAQSIFPEPNFAVDAPSNFGNQLDPAVDPD